MVSLTETGRSGMTNEDLYALCENSLSEHGHIVIPDDVLDSLDAESITAIGTQFSGGTLMLLPQREVTFFEWLRIEDPAVWADLWAGDDLPYIVSLAHLPDLVGASPRPTYVIRDLLTEDNYYFSPDLLIEKESDAFIHAVRDRMQSQMSLTISQLLALEASLGPVDIWHFAFSHKIALDVAKAAVAHLVDDRILLHVPRADHLAQYFDID